MPLPNDIVAFPVGGSVTLEGTDGRSQDSIAKLLSDSGLVEGSEGDFIRSGTDGIEIRPSAIDDFAAIAGYDDIADLLGDFAPKRQSSVEAPLKLLEAERIKITVSGEQVSAGPLVNSALVETVKGESLVLGTTGDMSLESLKKHLSSRGLTEGTDFVVATPAELEAAGLSRVDGRGNSLPYFEQGVRIRTDATEQFAQAVGYDNFAELKSKALAGASAREAGRNAQLAANPDAFDEEGNPKRVGRLGDEFRDQEEWQLRKNEREEAVRRQYEAAEQPRPRATGPGFNASGDPIYENTPKPPPVPGSPEDLQKQLNDAYAVRVENMPTKADAEVPRERATGPGFNASGDPIYENTPKPPPVPGSKDESVAAKKLEKEKAFRPGAHGVDGKVHEPKDLGSTLQGLADGQPGPDDGVVASDSPKRRTARRNGGDKPSPLNAQVLTAAQVNEARAEIQERSGVLEPDAAARLRAEMAELPAKPFPRDAYATPKEWRGKFGEQPDSDAKTPPAEAGVSGPKKDDAPSEAMPRKQNSPLNALELTEQQVRQANAEVTAVEGRSVALSPEEALLVKQAMADLPTKPFARGEQDTQKQWREKFGEQPDGGAKAADVDVSTPKSPANTVRTPDIEAPSIKGGGALGGALAGNLVGLGIAASSGNTEAVKSSAGFAAVDVAGAAVGGNVGNLANGAGMVGGAVLLATSASELESSGNPDQKERRTVNAAMMGSGLLAGVAAGTVAGASLGTVGGGFVGSAVGAAVGATVGAVDGVADESMYGSQDRRFNPDTDGKGFLRAALTRYSKKLDPKGEHGHLSLDTLRDNPEMQNRLAVILQREVDGKEQVMRDNSAWRPRWIRSDESVTEKESARGDVNIAKATQDELRQFIREDLTIKGNTKMLMALDQDGNGKLDASDLDRDRDGKLTRKDEAAIREALGNDKLASTFIENLKKNGVTFDGSQEVAATGPSQTPTMTGSGKTTLGA